MADALRFLSEATPYWYIGDSHAGIGTLVFEASDQSLVVARTIGIWRFVAADVLDDDGMISEPLMQVFRRIGAVHSSTTFTGTPGFRPVQTRYGNQRRLEQLKPTEAVNERAYVLSVGEINARNLLHQLANDEIDFTLPFNAQALDQLPSYSGRHLLGGEQALRLVANEFKPLFVGLRVLHDAGFRTIFLHALPPPTVDDDDAERVFKHRSSAVLRYKLTMLINYLFESVCRDIGIGFVNTWSDVAPGGVLDPEYYLDGLHLNRNGSVLSVQEVHRQFIKLRSQGQLLGATST